ncbi:MAG: protein kinase [Symploca sp. SIO2G7]|nr:protein kinase [Symploca sp. SIO2G7]
MTTVSPKVVGGHYQILRKLGEGGFGTTFLAEDVHRLNSKLVVKQLDYTSNNPEEQNKVEELFQREAETLLKLGEYDQIPYLFAYFQENQKFYLVQELIEGHQLSEELPPGKKLEEHQVIELLEEILEILKFVHTQGVIHRDIKPENIMRREKDDRLILIDFGGVKHIASRSGNTAIQGNSTQVYTRNYTPREQISGRPEFNSDIYPLGIIAIQALTGLEAKEIPIDSRTGEFIWREEAPQVSDRLATVVDKMVRDDFERRYKSVEDVLDDLRELKKTLVLGFQQTKPPGKTRMPKIRLSKRSLLLLSLVLAPLLAVIAFVSGFLFFLPRNSPNPSVSEPPNQSEPTVTPEPEATLSSPANNQPSPAATPSPTPSSEGVTSPESEVDSSSSAENQESVTATPDSTPPDSEEGGIFLRPESLQDSQ